MRKSLKSAEDSFRSNNDMRGELDLMLAEAEMQHLREKRGLTFNWTRQKLAAVFAVVLMLTGITGWLWAKNSIPPVVTDLPVIAASTQDSPVAKVLAIQAKTSVQVNEVAPEQVINEVVPPVQQDKIVYNEGPIVQQAGLQVPENEVRDLVRTARKTLSKSN